MVEEFLPAGFHLSRSRNRNISQLESQGILWGNDSILSGVKKVIDKTDPGSENNFNKIKSSDDDKVKEEKELKKKMQSIFGDLEDSD